jgi:hypothetical protein
MYQFIFGIFKAHLAHETFQQTADNTYIFTFTFETVQEEFRQKYATSKKILTPGKTQTVILVTTPSPQKSFPVKLKKDCRLCGKQ